MLRVLLEALGGGIGSQIRQAYQAKLTADTHEKKLAAETQIEALRTMLELRKATAANWEMRILVLMAGVPAALHFGAVCLDSIFNWPLVIQRLPEPMDDWQGTILLGLFGLIALKGMIGGRGR